MRVNCWWARSRCSSSHFVVRRRSLEFYLVMPQLFPYLSLIIHLHVLYAVCLFVLLCSEPNQHQPVQLACRWRRWQRQRDEPLQQHPRSGLLRPVRGGSPAGRQRQLAGGASAGHQPLGLLPRQHRRRWAEKVIGRQPRCCLQVVVSESTFNGLALLVSSLSLCQSLGGPRRCECSYWIRNAMSSGLVCLPVFIRNMAVRDGS